MSISCIRLEVDIFNPQTILMGRQRMTISKKLFDAAEAMNKASWFMQFPGWVMVQNELTGAHSNNVRKKVTTNQMRTTVDTMYTMISKGRTLKIR